MAARTKPTKAKPNPIPSVWAREQRAPDQPALSRDAIVREAIAMLDADGIEALSMRKLGARNTADLVRAALLHPSD